MVRGAAMLTAAGGESAGGDRRLELSDGSRVAVVGAGPAGSFFAYFLLALADRVGLELHVDLYESKDFGKFGPAGCNHCGGIVSESLVQLLATEGVNLPAEVIQRGIDSYVLHTDVGSVRIDTPLHEKRIAAVFRGAGPRGLKQVNWQSFDKHLQELAAGRGAQLIRARVNGLAREGDRILVKTKDGRATEYELVALACGVNSTTLKLIAELIPGYRAPSTTKTYICELPLGRDAIASYLGSSMHVFLLNIPRLEFAALIPKGEHATLCMLGEDIDQELIDEFMGSEPVRRIFPADWQMPKPLCHCWPRINIAPARQPYGDRVVVLGDSAVTRLYKDGIGAAYRAAKAAATTAVLEGVSADAFARGYWPTCKAIARDNLVGSFIFAASGLAQAWRPARRAMVRMTAREQDLPGKKRRMSTVLWDMFTGSAPYAEVLRRSLHPAFGSRLLWHLLASLLPLRRSAEPSSRRAGPQAAAESESAAGPAGA